MYLLLLQDSMSHSCECCWEDAPLAAVTQGICRQVYSCCCSTLSILRASFSVWAAVRPIPAAVNGFCRQQQQQHELEVIPANSLANSTGSQEQRGTDGRVVHCTQLLLGKAVRSSRCPGARSVQTQDDIALVYVQFIFGWLSLQPWNVKT